MVHSRTETPQMLPIKEVIQEGAGQITFLFSHQINSKPGQFIMIWLPGVDEKPMAVSYYKKKEFGITFQVLGRTTKKLAKLKKNDLVGIRGPYGNSFTLKAHSCVVGGGVGMASVSTLIDALKKPMVINGARSKKHLIYLNRYKKHDLITTTDDGSHGKKGFTTNALKEVLKKNKIKQVYTCGPEIMMKKIVDICNTHKVPVQASIERYMSCGFGVCGKCMLNDKIVCLDGPIFDQKQLKTLPEFGKFARLKSGRKVSLKKYHSTPT